MRKSEAILKLKNNWEKIIIFFLVLIVYNQWLFHFGYLVAGDWIFHNQASLLVFYRWPQLWDSMWGLGSIDILPVFDLIQFGYGILAHFFNYAVLERLFYFWPILAFSYFGILKLGKLIFKDDKVGIFFFALLFLFNTYILSVQIGFITYAGVYALSPLVFYLFIKLLGEKFSWRNILLAALILLLCSFYEPRGLVALSYFLLLYLIYIVATGKNHRTRAILSFVAAYAALLVFNLYWIIPQLFSAPAAVVPSTVGVFAPFNSILDALSLHSYAWQGNLLSAFSMVAFQKVIPSFYFFIVTLLVFCPILFYKKLKDSAFVLFLLASSLIGIFLLKQQNPPFGSVYEWLFHHLPTFDLFRESNKFIIFLLPISLLFGLAVSFLAAQLKTRLTRAIFFLLVAGLVLVNVIPILDRQIKTLFVNRSLPADYVILNKFILSQADYFRLALVPRDSNWIAYSDAHAKISDVGMVQGDWQGLFGYRYDVGTWPTEAPIMDVFQHDFSRQLFDVSSVKYVIVPVRDTVNDDDFFAYYGGQDNPDIRNWYIHQLDKIKWLKKIDIGTQDLVVYENAGYRDHIYATKEQETIYKNLPVSAVSWKLISPTEYQVSLPKIKADTYLNFSEKYDPGWSLRVGQFNWWAAWLGNDYALDDKYHYADDARLNSFLIDPNYLRQNLPAGSYRENPDGSLDLDVTIYFKPQSYLYLGLVISGVALLGAVVYLGYDFLQRRRAEKRR